MAYRFLANKLTALGLGASLVLGACVPVVTPGIPTVTITRGTSTPAEAELQKRSQALQKTIIEGAAAGAALGLAISLANGGANKWRNIAVGALIGGLAGGYVANLQKNFASREDQLKQAISDIDETNAETAATLQVMRTVMARDVADLRKFRAALAAGRTDSASLNARISAAKANLADMQGAISGAEARAAEFSQAQAAIVAQNGSGDGGGDISRELALLQDRIQQMRAVAADLSENI